MSANHEGYEQAMKDVLSVFDTANILSGALPFPDARRIAIERLRESNLKCQREWDERRPK